MSISIISNKRECYITGSTLFLDKHHCLPGTANRRKCERYGLWVYLNHSIHMRIHQDSNFKDMYGVPYRLRLEMAAQEAFEREHSHKEWMDLFHKNYLKDRHND